MPFKAILQDLALKAGATGAIMLDREGEVVASCAQNDSLQIDLIGAHHGIILNIIQDASTRSDFPEVSSVSISTDSAKLSISSIKEGYYLVVALEKRRPIGKTLFESRRAIKKIEEEMG
ncbi:MAG: roadblock/LC7 domain-containing protein [Deltaproteobacteria bacterium]|nr:roadblock/LC7 domain-containing protein [Deltaproteobacteria bacterium]